MFNCAADAWCIVLITVRPQLARSRNVANTWFADELLSPLNHFKNDKLKGVKYFYSKYRIFKYKKKNYKRNNY